MKNKEFFNTMVIFPLNTEEGRHYWKRQHRQHSWRVLYVAQRQDKRKKYAVMPLRPDKKTTEKQDCEQKQSSSVLQPS